MTESRSVPATRWIRSTNSVSSESQFIGPILEKQISKGLWTESTEDYQPGFVVSLAGLANPTFEIRSPKYCDLVQKCERGEHPQISQITQINFEAKG